MTDTLTNDDDLPRHVVRERFRSRYMHRPDLFVQECFLWPDDERPAKYQLEIVNLLTDHRRVSVRSPHGAGKTAMASWIILWFALTRDGDDWKIPTTASAWRQLSKFLWPEIKKWAHRLDWKKIGRDPFSPKEEQFTMNLKLATGEAFALASNDPNLIEGAHAKHILYLFDEAKAIPYDTWNSAEGAMSNNTGECLWLCISTPGEPSGRFYEIQTKKPGYEDWYVRQITLEEAIAEGRISGQWADDRRRQWGAKSAAFLNRVKAEFASSEADVVIPLEWIEASNIIWEDNQDFYANSRPNTLGADIARYGEDNTVLAFAHDQYGVSLLSVYAKEDTVQIANRIKRIMAINPGIVAVIDVIGIGAGVYDMVAAEFPRRTIPFNASNSSDSTDVSGEWGFRNVRSAAWWSLRERLDPRHNVTFGLPPNEELTADLMTPTWKYQSGSIVVESKEDIRKRLGRSTDYGDAVAEAVWSEDVSGGMDMGD